MNNNTYCQSLTQYKRIKTQVVEIGTTRLGGSYPIRVQSMTSTDTNDITTTVAQCKRIINAGSDYVRITTQGKKEAKSLFEIKKQLLQEGYDTPIIADIHFNPEIANITARLVAKVRINPGNYADMYTRGSNKKQKKSYQQVLEEIKERFSELLNICTEHNTAIRIGVNHGSLSERIVYRYGDTPKGMVESCMEFLRISHKKEFHNVVISMKSSNTRIMVHAYRLLSNQMQQEGMNYPLHIGVTEAGDGEDGRIKSAVGIGTLLADGLGDTIRVSLTEEPENEIPVGKAIVEYFTHRDQSIAIKEIDGNKINPFQYSKRETIEVRNIGKNNPPIVIANLLNFNKTTFFKLTNHILKGNLWIPTSQTPEFVYIADKKIDFDIAGKITVICNYKNWKNQPKHYPLFSLEEYLENNNKSETLNFVTIKYNHMNEKNLNLLKNEKNTVLIIETNHLNGVAEQRAFFIELMNQNLKIPVIIKRNYQDTENKTHSTIPDITLMQLKAACDIGPLLIDGLGDGVWIEGSNNIKNNEILKTSFGILQASRARVTQTEYISCPSCGRTLFELQEVTKKVKQATHKLKNLKIGIMGCIVNGIGEMGDADYGYVGVGKGKVNLYKKQTLVKKNIPAAEAVNELLQLIRDNGDWKEVL